MNGGPSFAQQRLICIALLLGMVLYTVAVAVALRHNDGVGYAAPPVPELDDVALYAGMGTALTALILRTVLRMQAASAAEERRRQLRFVATLAPLACLEAGCLLALTVWLLNGTAMPAFAIAMILLSLAILVVPFSDPDQAS